MRRLSFSALSYQRALAIVAGGTSSIIAAAIATNILRIASSMTLTRLLDARTFGIVAIVTSVAIILQLLSDIGVQPFVIRHERGDDREFLDEIWTLRLIRSTILTIVMAVLSVSVARLIGKPELAVVLAVWSIIFIIDGFSSMTFATAIRKQKVWRLTISELITSVSQLIFSITLAVIFRSYWALIIAMLASAVLKSVLSYSLFPDSRRKWKLSRERAKEMWTFSRFIALSSVMTVLMMQADKLILARFMPLSAYGLYAVAATLSAAGPAMAVNYGRRILYPIYAEAARMDLSNLRKVFYQKRRLISLAYIFAMGGIIGSAKLIIALLYDPRYIAVTLYLQLLSISSALIVINNSSEEVLIAAQNIRATFFTNASRTVWLLCGIALAIYLGQTIMIVATIGTIEVPALLVNWLNLYRVKLLDLKEEALGGVVGLAGVASGFAMASLAFTFFPIR